MANAIPAVAGLFSIKNESNEKITGDIKMILAGLPSLEVSRLTKLNLILHTKEEFVRQLMLRRTERGVGHAYTQAMSDFSGNTGGSIGFSTPKVIEHTVSIDSGIAQGATVESLDLPLVDDAGNIYRQTVRTFLENFYTTVDLLWLSAFETINADAAWKATNTISLAPSEQIITTKEKALTIYHKVLAFLTDALNHKTKLGQVKRDNLVILASRSFARMLELAKIGSTFNNAPAVEGNSLEIFPDDKIGGVNVYVHPLLGQNTAAGDYNTAVGADMKDVLAIVVEKLPTPKGTTSAIVMAQGMTQMWSKQLPGNNNTVDGFKAMVGVSVWDAMKTRIWAITTGEEATEA